MKPYIDKIFLIYFLKKLAYVDFIKVLNETNILSDLSNPYII